jgi:hypothetical protein
VLHGLSVAIGATDRDSARCHLVRSAPAYSGTTAAARRRLWRDFPEAVDEGLSAKRSTCAARAATLRAGKGHKRSPRGDVRRESVEPPIPDGTAAARKSAVPCQERTFGVSNRAPQPGTRGSAQRLLGVRSRHGSRLEATGSRSCPILQPFARRSSGSRHGAPMRTSVCTIVADNSEAFDACPVRYEGSRKGSETDLRLHYRLMLLEQGFVVAYVRPSEFKSAR